MEGELHICDDMVVDICASCFETQCEECKVSDSSPDRWTQVGKQWMCNECTKGVLSWWLDRPCCGEE